MDEQVCIAGSDETFRRPSIAPAQRTAAEQQAADAQQAQQAATESGNELTLRQQAEAALATNRTARNQILAWRTTGPGAGSANLTAAQSSLALRQQADNQAEMLRQQNGIIRLLLRKLDGTD